MLPQFFFRNLGDIQIGTEYIFLYCFPNVFLVFFIWNFETKLLKTNNRQKYFEENKNIEIMQKAQQVMRNWDIFTIFVFRILSEYKNWVPIHFTLGIVKILVWVWFIFSAFDLITFFLLFLNFLTFVTVCQIFGYLILTQFNLLRCHNLHLKNKFWAQLDIS